MEGWAEIVTDVVASGVIPAGVSYLITSFLNRLNEEKIRVLQDKLDRSSLEHNVAFTHLHQKRADAIEKVYNAAWDTIIKCNTLTAEAKFITKEIKNPEELEEFDTSMVADFAQSIMNLISCVTSSEIYFCENTSQTIKEMPNIFRRILSRHRFSNDVRKMYAGESDLINRINSDIEDAKEKCQELHEQLRKDFQKLLFPEDKQKTKTWPNGIEC